MTKPDYETCMTSKRNLIELQTEYDALMAEAVKLAEALEYYANRMDSGGTARSSLKQWQAFLDEKEKI